MPISFATSFGLKNYSRKVQKSCQKTKLNQATIASMIHKVQSIEFKIFLINSPCSSFYISSDDDSDFENNK